MVYFILMTTLIMIMILYFFLFSLSYKKGKKESNMSSYECGFDPSSLTRVSFSYRFFLISILFLIFDVEVTLLLPIPFLIKSFNGMLVFLIFVFILILGLIYEYYCGSLEWVNNFVSKA